MYPLYGCCCCSCVCIYHLMHFRLYSLVPLFHTLYLHMAFAVTHTHTHTVKYLESIGFFSGFFVPHIYVLLAPLTQPSWLLAAVVILAVQFYPLSDA